MFKFKIIDDFKTLNSEEFQEFGKFLNSPVFNTHKDVIKFYNTIKQYYPGFIDEDLNPNAIYHKMFGKRTPYKEKTLFNLSTYLTSLFERFLIYLEHKNEPFYTKKFLFQQLQRRSLTRLFEKNLEITSELLENMQFKDEEYYLNKFMLETLRREFYVNHRPFTKLQDEFKKHDEELDNIIFFFQQ